MPAMDLKVRQDDRAGVMSLTWESLEAGDYVSKKL